MSNPKEVLFTTDASSENIHVNVWDPNSTTSLFKIKAPTPIQKNTLCFLKNEYILSASKSQAMLNIWRMNSTNPGHGRNFGLPGLVKCLSVSPDGNYCVGSVDKQIYVWHVSSGKLFSILESHYGTVSCLKFLDDGSHFVSAADDGLVLIWSLSQAVSINSEKTIEPIHKISDHTIQITDLFVGKGGSSCRIVSVSLDKTCRIYEFAHAKLLLTLVFNDKLTAVTMNKFESLVFVGTDKGDVFKFDLLRHFPTKEHHVSEDELKNVFKGHTGRINCLTVTSDNLKLISGSEDHYVFIWSIDGCVKLRQIKHSSAIMNIVLQPTYCNMFVNQIDNKMVISKFEKSIVSSGDSSNFIVRIITSEDVNVGSENGEFDCYSDRLFSFNNGLNGDDEGLLQEIEKLKEMNHLLYVGKIDEFLKEDVHLKSDLSKSVKESKNNMSDVDVNKEKIEKSKKKEGNSDVLSSNQSNLTLSSVKKKRKKNKNKNRNNVD